LLCLACEWRSAKRNKSDHAAAYAVMMTPLGHPPISWFYKGWRIDYGGRGAFVVNNRFLICFYVLSQIAVAIVNVTAHYVSEKTHKDIYCEGYSFAFSSCVYPWTSWYLLFWQCAAVYALVQFYHELKAELDNLQALPKLMLIKLVVFVSFWQSLCISGLTTVGVIHAAEGYSVAEVGIALQNFTICCEMAVAALLHHYYFSQTEFVGERGVSAGVLLYEAGPLTPCAALHAFNPLPIVGQSLRFVARFVSGRASFDVPKTPVFEHKRKETKGGHGKDAGGGDEEKGGDGGDVGAANAPAPAPTAALTTRAVAVDAATPRADAAGAGGAERGAGGASRAGSARVAAASSAKAGDAGTSGYEPDVVMRPGVP